MITQGELEQILTSHIEIKNKRTHTITGQSLDPFILGIPEAAEAIVARLERLRLIIEMLTERGDDPHAVDECIKAATALMVGEETIC